MSIDDEEQRGFASPPCYAHELTGGSEGTAAWRKSERERLIAARLAVPAEDRRRASLARLPGNWTG